MIENKIVTDSSRSINQVLAEANAEGWRAIHFDKIKHDSGLYYVLMEREVPDK